MAFITGGLCDGLLPHACNVSDVSGSVCAYVLGVCFEVFAGLAGNTPISNMALQLPTLVFFIMK